MTRADDTELIVKRLTDDIERLLDTYASGWVPHKGCAHPSPKSKKQLGSFKVNLVGGRRGQWYRFSQGFGGGPVKLLAYFLNGTTHEPSRSEIADAFKEARIFLGMNQGEVDHEAIQKAKEHRERQVVQREAEEAAAREFNEEAAMDLWMTSSLADGTLAEVYFRSRVRGWDGFHTDQIRFHPEAYYSKTQKLPCIVCLVTGPDGNPAGVWRIYLNADGTNFYDWVNGKWAKVKKGLGPCMEVGGAIRLFPATDTIGACEGVETGYGAWNLCLREIPIWPVMATSGMVNFRPPFGIERVAIFPDGDLEWSEKRSDWRDPPGFKAARTLQKRMHDLGLISPIDPVPADGLDHLERWNEAYDAGLRVNGEIAV